jgi:hypothetical protein
MAHITAPLKEQRRQDCPAAIAGLIEGAPLSVNAFRPRRNRQIRLGGVDKVLMRLNFSGRPGNG